MSTEGLPTAFGRYKSFAASLVVIILVLYIALQGIKGTIDEVLVKRGEIAQAKEKLNALQKKENLLKNENTENLLVEADKLNNAIPSAIDLTQILAVLQWVAFKTNVALGELSIASDAQTITILPVAKGEKLSRFQFKVNLSGSFEDTQKFIDRLASISPIFRAEKLTFAGNNALIVVNFYFQPSFLRKESQLDASIDTLEDAHNKAIAAIMQLEIPQIEEPDSASPSASSGLRKSPFQ